MEVHALCQMTYQFSLGQYWNFLFLPLPPTSRGCVIPSGPRSKARENMISGAGKPLRIKSSCGFFLSCQKQKQRSGQHIWRVGMKGGAFHKGPQSQSSVQTSVPTSTLVSGTHLPSSPQENFLGIRVGNERDLAMSVQLWEYSGNLLKTIEL